MRLTARNVWTKFVWKIKRHISRPITYPHPLPNHAVYEQMWKNMVRVRRHDNIIRRMRTACWITKVTNTHLEYVIYNCFSAVTVVAGTRLFVTLYVRCS